MTTLVYIFKSCWRLNPELYGQRLFSGANFASAGVGILNDTEVTVFLLFLTSSLLLQRIYDLGARKVLVTGTGPMGCVPAELAMHSRNGECAADIQEAASLFNPQLEQMLKGLNSKLGKDVFIAANTHQTHNNFLTNPRAYGFISTNKACCGQGPYNGLGLCTPASNLCPNRDQYAFWDPFHPSEKANKYIVQQILTGSTKYMTPMNLSTILAMDFN